METNLQNLTLGQLFELVEKKWDNPSYAAVPYIAAGKTLQNMSSMYLADSAEEITLRFLCNANYWRGGESKPIKNEFKRRLKDHQK